MPENVAKEAMQNRNNDDMDKARNSQVSADQSCESKLNDGNKEEAVKSTESVASN